MFPATRPTATKSHRNPPSFLPFFSMISTPGDIFFVLKQKAVRHFFTAKNAKEGRRKAKDAKDFLYKMPFFTCLEQFFVGKKSFRCSVFHKSTAKQSHPTTDVIEFCCSAFSCLLSPVSCLPFCLFRKQATRRYVPFLNENEHKGLNPVYKPGPSTTKPIGFIDNVEVGIVLTPFTNRDPSRRVDSKN